MTFDLHHSWQSYSSDELLSEYQTVGIGNKILQTINQICKQIATDRRYHAAVYNEGRPWNVAAWEDLAQDVCTVQLYGQKSLIWVFEADAGQDVGSIEARLVTVVKRQLAARRREIDPIETRLKERCLSSAEEHGFSVVGTGRHAVISVDVGALDPGRALEDWDMQKVRRVACIPEIASVPKLFSQSEHKQSMGYTLPNLLKVLQVILDRETHVAAANLEKIFRELFTFLANHAHVPIEGSYESAQDAAMNAIDSQTRTDLFQLTEQISDRQAESMLYKLHGYSDEEIRIATGVSRPTIQKDREKIVEGLQRLADRNGLDESQGSQLLDEFVAALEDRVAIGPRDE